MGLTCEVCKHPDVADIDIAIVEGQGSHQIATDYKVGRNAVDYHRKAGHASRAITRAVISAAATAQPLSDLARIAITRKQHRLQVLDHTLALTVEAIEQQAAVNPSSIDPKLVAQIPVLCATASKELGTWQPDGGANAEATAKFAQAIVIHSATAAALAAGRSQGVPADSVIEALPEPADPPK